jgi:outer membrane lipoprotein-sorting protein
MPVHCDGARAAISERLDGEHLRGRRAAALDEHLATCAACRSFEARAWRLRESSRIALAPAVPDLIEPIMAAVEAEPDASGRRRVVLLGPRLPLGSTRRLAPLAAALAVGLLAGSLTFGGPWHSPERGPGIAAADVSRGVAEAATRLTGYHAVFSMKEHDPRRDEEVRNLTMSVWFRAPERFRLDVVDHGTGDPQATPDDLRFVVNGDESYTETPSLCPVGPCPPRRSVVRGRTPFTGAATATDLVLPVSTLVDAQELRVLGRDTVGGRPAIRVELPFERARPLFPFMSIGGSWRPFFPGDRVELLLDARDWFPLRYSVYPAGSPNRDEWALRFGLLPEAARRPIFEVTTIEIDRARPSASVFRIPVVGSTDDEGARTIPLDRVESETDLRPAPVVGGLDLYRVTVPDAAARADGASPTVVTYASGLSWLKLGETGSPSAGSLFERVAPHAEEIVLPNGGIAYYEPATDSQGRRLTLHTERGDVAVETNLARDGLIEAAASLPVTGLPAPRRWLVRRSAEGVTQRVSLDEAIDEAPFELALPEEVPDGYILASTELVTIEDSVAVNVYFQRFDAAFLRGPIRLHEELGDVLPPASSDVQELVRLEGSVVARWTPSGSRLEWVDDGVYQSLDGRGATLEELLAIAMSIDRDASVSA